MFLYSKDRVRAENIGVIQMGNKNHVDKALVKAEYYSSIGNNALADKFFKIAEKYEALINKQKEADEKRKQK